MSNKLSARPFLLVKLLERPARTSVDVRNEKANIVREAAKRTEEEGHNYTDALHLALSKVEPATPTQHPLARIGKGHEKRAWLEDNRARSAYLNSLRIPGKDKQAAKQAWTPLRKTKLRKSRGELNSFESVQIVDRIKPSHLTGANVIIDILLRTLIKSNISEPGHHQQVVDHFLSKYEEYCKTGVDRYLTKMAS